MRVKRRCSIISGIYIFKYRHDLRTICASWAKQQTRQEATTEIFDFISRGIASREKERERNSRIKTLLRVWARVSPRAARCALSAARCIRGKRIVRHDVVRSKWRIADAHSNRATGPGIPPTHIVFQRYEAAARDARDNRAAWGTRLGDSVVTITSSPLLSSLYTDTTVKRMRLLMT